MFSISENKFVLGKENIYPFSAEMHYFRVDKKYWSICFERIKKAGIRVITSPVPWSLHQDKNRDVDFMGLDDSRKDLTVFLELARELGFKVILRPGPAIGPDWPNNGIPEYVTSDIRSLARDKSGEFVALPGDAGIKGGYLVSYLSPSFQNSVKSYFKTFVDMTRNYIHPRGPIVALEFDWMPGFGGHFDPGASDYNEDMLTREFAPFLMDRFETIKDLNSAYKSKFDEFEEVTPPREFEGVDHKGLPQIFDWFRFHGRVIRRYIEAQKVIYEGYTVHPTLSVTFNFAPKDLLPFYHPGSFEELTLFGAPVSYTDTYSEVARRARYMRGSKFLVWAGAYPSGRATENPQRAAETAPPTDGERRFLVASALGSGFKGANFRMFVDHQRWYGGALKEDGSVSRGYDFISRVLESADKMSLDELAPEASVAVVGNRLYQWFARLKDPKEFEYIGRLIHESLPSVCRDLQRLKIDYDICESSSIAELNNYKLVIIPSAEFMSESEQQAIIDLSKAGVAIALFGVPPRLDENMNDCALLANYMKIKATLVNAVQDVTTKSDTFPAYIYSTLKASDARGKKPASVGKNLVGFASSKKGGSLCFYGFDISSGFDHHRLLFLEQWLAEEKIKSNLYCSDPLVDIVAHSNGKKVALYLMAPPAGALGDRVETENRRIFIKVDLKNYGFKTPNIKLTDLLEPEDAQPIKTTMAALADGLEIDLSFPDGKVFLIERR